MGQNDVHQEVTDCCHQVPNWHTRDRNTTVDNTQQMREGTENNGKGKNSGNSEVLELKPSGGRERREMSGRNENRGGGWVEKAELNKVSEVREIRGGVRKREVDRDGMDVIEEG